MRQLSWVCGAGLIIVACGGRARSTAPDASGGASSYAGATADEGGTTTGVSETEAGAPGVGPIDATSLATEFPKPSCTGPLASLQLALPCKVGQPLNNATTGVSVVECDDIAGRTALNLAVDLTSAAGLIGTALPLPSEPALPQVPTVSIEVESVHYTGVLQGSLTFEQVDPTGRAFVARLTDEFIAWQDPQGKETDCAFASMRLWATAGDFL